MIKTLLPAVALTATAVLAAAPAHAASSTTYFGGHGGLSTSHTFNTSEGVEIKATATAWNPKKQKMESSHVGQYWSGLGATNSIGKKGKDGSHQIDGSGHKDIVWLEFSESFALESALFSYVDCNDDVRLYDGDMNNLGDVDLHQNGSIFGFAKIDLSSLNIIGNKIGFAAIGSNDDFKLKGVTGHAVPTPSAAAAGILGLAALSARRRRREEAAAE